MLIDNVHRPDCIKLNGHGQRANNDNKNVIYAANTGKTKFQAYCEN